MTKVCRILGNAVVAVALLANPILAQAASNTAAAPVSEQAQAAAEIEANKAAVVGELVARWQGAIALGEDGYAERITDRLMKMSGEELLQVRSATTWEAVQPQVFGDLTTDLVYTPLASCRLMDTRFGTGSYAVPLAPNTNLGLSVNDGLAAQGGSATGCDPGNLGLNDDPPALAIIMHAVPVSGSGNLRAFPGDGSGAPVPSAASLTYATPTVVSSGVITQSCTGCSEELNVRNQGGGTTHVIVDIVGFFHIPNATAVACTTVSTQESHTTFFSMTSGACPAGFTYTGGGHDWVAGSTDVWFFQVSPNVTTGAASATTCRGNVNRGGAASFIRCYATCCKVPGR